MWHVFLHQAVWRFEIWLKCVVKPGGVTARTLRNEEILPLDVLLIWHAYFLNPYIYADDTTRVHPELAALGGLPLERVVRAPLRCERLGASKRRRVCFWELSDLFGGSK